MLAIIVWIGGLVFAHFFLRPAVVAIRAKVEHLVRVIKRHFGFVKVRYRGLAKNTAQLKTLFALSNLWMVRHKLVGLGA